MQASRQAFRPGTKLSRQAGRLSGQFGRYSGQAFRQQVFGPCSHSGKAGSNLGHAGRPGRQAFCPGSQLFGRGRQAFSPGRHADRHTFIPGMLAGIWARQVLRRERRVLRPGKQEGGKAGMLPHTQYERQLEGLVYSVRQGGRKLSTEPIC